MYIYISIHTYVHMYMHIHTYGQMELVIDFPIMPMKSHESPIHIPLNPPNPHKYPYNIFLSSNFWLNLTHRTRASHHWHWPVVERPWGLVLERLMYSIDRYWNMWERERETHWRLLKSIEEYWRILQNMAEYERFRRACFSPWIERAKGSGRQSCTWDWGIHVGGWLLTNYVS